MREMVARYHGGEATEADVDIGFEEFPSEGLSAFVLAREDDAVLGCAALTVRGDGVGELGRMYVVPSARRGGVGRLLVAEIERLARERGVARLRLDTRADLVEARALYARIGYEEVAPFGDNPYADHYFQKDLR